MTIKNLYPKARPYIIYNVINGRPELPAQASFSRTSTGTYVDRAGIIRTAAVDEPRFNYDPETGEFLGLLLDKERTNLKTYSTDYTQTSNATGGYYGSSNGITTSVILNAGIAPDGTMAASKVGKTNLSQTNFVYSRGVINQNNTYTTGSVFVKANTYKYFKFQYINTSGRGYALNLNLETDEVYFEGNPRDEYEDGSYTVSKYPGGWYRVSVTMKQVKAGAPNIAPRLYPSNVWASEGAGIPTAVGDLFLWGLQVEETYEGSGPNPYIPTEGTTVTTSPDAFSLTSSSNFDGGFSLLLDSNKNTDDFIYKIKAGGSTIAELNNDNGTLDWVIDGTSAATSVPPQYPQIGAIQPGRVRTVSSFGAAGDGDQTNYLYTESLSFPTVAEPAAGADELEFGPGQTVKAVYVWDGQLSNTEAVSVIKGEYNVILNEPIQADTYSFVYNTDPTNVGEASITLPYIVPTVSMRVYWGDTTSDRYEPGVTPSHTYPYPGQYRIQIEADDGFDAVRLGGSLYPDIITRLDQWPPQFRVGASGPGFTGDQLYYILYNQKALGGTIPAFKYTDLTTLAAAFAQCTGQVTPINLSPWEYIPTNIPLVTTLSSAFSAFGRYNNEASPDRTNFPTLQTSSLLTNVSSCFANTKMTNFVNDRPFTDTSGVTNFRNCFAGANLANCIIDTSSGTNLEGLFARCSFTISPSIDTSDATDLSTVMSQNDPLTTQLFWDTSSVTDFTSSWSACPLLNNFPLLDTSSGTNFSSAWYGCSALTSFPQIDTSSGTNFDQAWSNCSALTSFPLIDLSSATVLTAAWSGCSGLTSFPLIVPSGVNNFQYTWRSCTSLTSFPAIDTSSATSFSNTWLNCSALTSFSLLSNTSNVTNFGASWEGCNSLTAFPAIDFSSALQCYRAWLDCTNLATFPANLFDTTGTLESYAFEESWQNCALTAQSIENILVSLDTNGASNITLSLSGGTNAGQSTWTAAANTAYTNLINKGWTITFNP